MKGRETKRGGVEKESESERVRNYTKGAVNDTRHEPVIRESSNSQLSCSHIWDTIESSLCYNVLVRFFSCNPYHSLWSANNTNVRQQSVSKICKVLLRVMVCFAICFGETESIITNIRHHGSYEICGMPGISVLNRPNASGGALERKEKRGKDASKKLLSWKIKKPIGEGWSHREQNEDTGLGYRHTDRVDRE